MFKTGNRVLIKAGTGQEQPRHVLYGFPIPGIQHADGRSCHHSSVGVTAEVKWVEENGDVYLSRLTQLGTPKWGYYLPESLELAPSRKVNRTLELRKKSK